jgi:hypothetical protein
MGRMFSRSLYKRPIFRSLACDGVSWNLQTKGKAKLLRLGSKARELGNIFCTYLG